MINSRLVQLLGTLLDCSIRNDRDSFNRNNAVFESLLWQVYPNLRGNGVFEKSQLDNMRQSCFYATNGMREIALLDAFKRYIQIKKLL